MKSRWLSYNVLNETFNIRFLMLRLCKGMIQAERTVAPGYFEWVHALKKGEGVVDPLRSNKLTEVVSMERKKNKREKPLGQLLSFKEEKILMNYFL